MAKIVVLGSLNQDIVITVARLPQPGETVLGTRLASYPGGKGANQAVAAARLGGQVAMVGRVGSDDFGASLVTNLAANGVDASGVERDPATPTGAALIYVEDSGQNMIAVAPGANAAADVTDVQRALARLEPGDVLLMQLEIPIIVVEKAAAAARQAGAYVVLNAAPAQPLKPDLLSQLAVLVVNEREARALAPRTDGSPEAAVQALCAMGPKLAVVTLGPSGSVHCDTTGVHRVEPFAVQALDSTGAGDAFMGAMAVGMAQKLDTQAAVRFANAAGAAATTALGAQAALPRLDDLRRLFDLPSLED